MPAPTKAGALLRKQRRKANRLQRQTGAEVIGHFRLDKLQRKAERDIKLRQALNNLGQDGRRAKRELGVVEIRKQFNRDSLRGFWNPEGKHLAR